MQEAIAKLLEERMGVTRTRVIEVTHITNLTGQILPVRDIVRLNAAAAVLAAGKADQWPQAVAVARESLDSGRAKQALSRLVDASKSA